MVINKGENCSILMKKYNTIKPVLLNKPHAKENRGSLNQTEPIPKCVDTSTHSRVNPRLSTGHQYKRKQSESTVPVRRFQTECGVEPWKQGVKQLRNHVSSLSFKHRFNRPKKIATKPQSQQNSFLERKRFMMRQISMTQTEEQQIMDQSRFLQQYQHSRESVLKKVGKNQKEEQMIIECMKTISRIYHALKELQNMGFALRNNKKVIRYCRGNYLWLKKVFLQRSSNKKDAFLLDPKDLVVQKAEQAQRNLVSLYMSGRGVEPFQMKQDLFSFLQELDSYLSHKKTVELREVTKYIGGHHDQGFGHKWQLSLYFKSCVGQKVNYSHDLNQLEQRCGRMNAISKVTRRKYEELNCAYDHLHTLH